MWQARGMVGKVGSKFHYSINMVHLVKIPCDDNHQLIEEEIIVPSTNVVHGDVIPTYLLTIHTTNQGGDNTTIIDTTPLLRFDKLSAGLYAYSISTTSKLQASSPPTFELHDWQWHAGVIHNDL